MSPHPFYLGDRLLRALAETPAVCPHMHLPVQSGSDPVLQRMRRNYTRAEFLEKVRALRALRPGFEVTTDFIVGFPGETEEDFRRTLSLAEESDVESAYCFKYSPRPGTDAARLPDDVPTAVKEERLARLLALTDALSRRKSAALLGTRQEVLVERADPATGRREGKTRSFWKIAFASRRARRPGDLVEVEVTEADGRFLGGRDAG